MRLFDRALTSVRSAQTVKWAHYRLSVHRSLSCKYLNNKRHHTNCSRYNNTLKSHRTQARLTCFRWHLNVFFLHLGDNRTFHLTITEPSKSSNPVREHWWASLIGFYWKVYSIIRRCNLSSASVTIPDESRMYLVPGFLYSPASFSSSFLFSEVRRPGRGQGTWICFFGEYMSLCQLRRLGFYHYYYGSYRRAAPLYPSLRSLHSCANNMENPGERRKTTEEMGQGRAVSSPPLLQINNIARKALNSDGKHRETTSMVGFDPIKSIPLCTLM